MGQKEIPLPAVVGAIAVVILLVGFFLFKSMVGGTVGQGQAGSIQASPPLGDAAKQQLMQQARSQQRR